MDQSLDTGEAVIHLPISFNVFTLRHALEWSLLIIKLRENVLMGTKDLLALTVKKGTTVFQTMSAENVQILEEIWLYL